MTWLATLHGDADHLGAEGAAAAENAVRDALQAIADKLVPDGHVGVGATFHGSTTGEQNLLQPDAPTDPGPPVTGEPVETTPVEAPAPGEAVDQEQEQLPGPASAALDEGSAAEGTAPEPAS
jgi:hypothetical protein